MAGSVCIGELKRRRGQAYGTGSSACPSPSGCPVRKARDLEQKQAIQGRVDSYFYIVQKMMNIRERARPSTRIYARIENSDHLSTEEIGMREKQIEQKLVRAVKNIGGIAPKFVSPGFDGMPDRIVLLPGGHIGFVEVKAPGEKPRPLQLARHGLLRRLGFKVYVLDDEQQIGGILDEIRTA